MVNLGKTITRVVGHPLGKNRPNQSIVKSKTIGLMVTLSAKTDLISRLSSQKPSGCWSPSRKKPRLFFTLFENLSVVVKNRPVVIGYPSKLKIIFGSLVPLSLRASVVPRQFQSL
jgi:hypothetical protein